MHQSKLGNDLVLLDVQPEQRSEKCMKNTLNTGKIHFKNMFKRTFGHMYLGIVEL